MCSLPAPGLVLAEEAAAAKHIQAVLSKPSAPSDAQSTSLL